MKLFLTLIVFHEEMMHKNYVLPFYFKSFFCTRSREGDFKQIKLSEQRLKELLFYVIILLVLLKHQLWYIDKSGLKLVFNAFYDFNYCFIFWVLSWTTQKAAFSPVMLWADCSVVTCHFSFDLYFNQNGIVKQKLVLVSRLLWKAIHMESYTFFTFLQWWIFWNLTMPVTVQSKTTSIRCFVY